MIVQVPLGTVVYELPGKGVAGVTPMEPEDSEGKAPGIRVGELITHGERFLIAKAGRGGRGNARFKTSINRAPRYRERGFPGEEKTLVLELKLLADVGLIGMPNAGKSSLLARITAARPKIADYPFTTLSPALGVCFWKDHSFVIADIPGLIEGAHQGKGLGHEFLRHVERTKALVHLVEPKEKGSWEDIKTIEAELGLWDASLKKKPRLIAVSKADLGPAAKKTLKELSRRRRKIKIYLISAQTGEGLNPLLNDLLKLLS